MSNLNADEMSIRLMRESGPQSLMVSKTLSKEVY